MVKLASYVILNFPEVSPHVITGIFIKQLSLNVKKVSHSTFVYIAFDITVLNNNFYYLLPCFCF